MLAFFFDSPYLVEIEDCWTLGSTTSNIVVPYSVKDFINIYTHHRSTHKHINISEVKGQFQYNSWWLSFVIKFIFYERVACCSVWTKAPCWRLFFFYLQWFTSINCYLDGESVSLHSYTTFSYIYVFRIIFFCLGIMFLVSRTYILNSSISLYDKKENIWPGISDEDLN